jgi:hypothetical protein
VDLVGQRRIEIFTELLGMFRPGRMVDLGAGHGSFSIVAAASGWEVDAVDARTERNTPAPGVTWIESDVRTVSLDGYDLVACLGLFYHLTADDQIDLLRRCHGTPIIVDTHLANGLSRLSLSDQVEERGYQGHWFIEIDGYASSWGNERSFWPTPESFLGMLRDAGYRVTMAVEPWYLPDRTFFVSIPSSASRVPDVPLSQTWQSVP